jgi:hypothetical protein
MPVAPVQIDARGLEPPQPLVLILEALATLPREATLVACTDRNPVHLHGVLAERGFTGTTQPAPAHDHGFITVIRHAR